MGKGSGCESCGRRGGSAESQTAPGGPLRELRGAEGRRLSRSGSSDDHRGGFKTGRGAGPPHARQAHHYQTGEEGAGPQTLNVGATTLKTAAPLATGYLYIRSRENQTPAPPLPPCTYLVYSNVTTI